MFLKEIESDIITLTPDVSLLRYVVDSLLRYNPKKISNNKN